MPRRRQPDPLLVVAGQIVAGWVIHARIPETAIAGVVHRLHQQMTRMDLGKFNAWEGDVPLGPDVLDAAEAERASREVVSEPKVYPAPQHPLAQPGVNLEDKWAGTVADDKITCLECGKGVILLKTHIRAMHDGMTWAEYLDRHGLPDDYPAVTAKLRREQSEKMTRYKGSGELMDETELKRKPKGPRIGIPKKKTDLKTKVEFQGDMLRDAGGDDELGRTG